MAITTTPDDVQDYLRSILDNAANFEIFRDLHLVPTVITANMVTEALAGETRRAAGVIRNLLHGVELALGRDCRPTLAELDEPVSFDDTLSPCELLRKRYVRLWQFLWKLDRTMFQQYYMGLS